MMLFCPTCKGTGTYYNPAPPGIGEVMPCSECVGGILIPEEAKRAAKLAVMGEYANLFVGRFTPDATERVVNTALAAGLRVMAERGGQ